MGGWQYFIGQSLREYLEPGEFQDLRKTNFSVQ
jgi:hypothetical protein